MRIQSADEFGKRLYLEAWKRGWSRAENKVVIGDGAEWIWNLAGQHFPGAVQIVDLYHARQHLWELARKLHPNDEVSQKARIKIHQKRLLDKGNIEKLVAAIRAIHSTNPDVAEKIRTEADYFETNTERMRCPKFRRQHLFVGYGYLWWITKVAEYQGFYARGYGGQYMLVLPKLDLVVLCTSDWQRPEYPEHFALVEEFLLPAIQPQAHVIRRNP